MKKFLAYVAPLAALFLVTAVVSAVAGVTPSSMTSLRSPTPVVNGPILSGRLLNIGETVSSPPYLGAGAQRPVGSLLYDRAGAIAYEKTGASATSWEQITTGAVGGAVDSRGQRTVRAQQLVGFGTALTCFREDFAATAPTNYTTIIAGSATSAASSNNDIGAHWLLQTGATASSRMRYGGNGNVIGRPDTQRFYAAFRFAVLTGVDAQTQLAIGFTNVSLVGVQFGPGICGGSSTTNYVFTYDATTLATCAGTVVATSVAVSTAQHVWEIWGVGDNKLHYAADGVELVGSPVTQAAAGTNSLRFQSDLLNGTTAANREIDLDWLQICWSET